MPQLQLQQSPKRTAETRCFPHQALDSRHIVKATFPRTLRQQHVAEELACRPARPMLQRNREAHFVLRSEEHTSELQSQFHLVCRLLLEKKKKIHNNADGAPHNSNPPQQPVDSGCNAIWAYPFVPARSGACGGCLFVSALRSSCTLRWAA